MLKFIRLFMAVFMISSCSYAKQPDIIALKNYDEYDKFLGSSGSSDIKFNIDDYVGTWSDPMKREMDFILTKDLNLILDWRDGKCKIVEQTNNTMLLKCVGNFAGAKKGGVAYVDNQYVKVQIFYFPDSESQAGIRLNITFNQDIECARKGVVQDKDCFNKGNDDKNVSWVNKSYDMYYKK
jgi:hypothetical protein